MTDAYIITRIREGKKEYYSSVGPAQGYWSEHRRDSYRYRIEKAAARRALVLDRKQDGVTVQVEEWTA